MRIIFFDVDSLRPDHLGCYGYGRPTSPTIDAIAADGCVFRQCYVSDSPCMPSRHALHSGRFGINNGVVTHGGPQSRMRVRERLYGGPDPQQQVLPRVLREAGIDSICISNFAWRHSAGWFGLGWTEFHSPSLQCGGESGEDVNRGVLRWLHQNRGRDNWYLHVNYWDVHRTYRMAPHWGARLAQYPISQAWPEEVDIQRHQAMSGPFTARNQFSAKSDVPLMPDAIRSRADFEQLVNGYDTAIAYADAQINVILDELKAQGIYEDTVIVVSADHGEALGEHGIYADHVNADSCIHHVPLIVRWPGKVQPHSSYKGLCYQLDWAPTLCELAGTTAPSDWDGISLARQLCSGIQDGREFLVWSHGLYSLQRAVKMENHLLIRTYHDHGYGWPGVQIFDTDADPYLTQNLSGEQSELTARLTALLEEWLSRHHRNPGAQNDPLLQELEYRRSGQRRDSLGSRHASELVK